MSKIKTVKQFKNAINAAFETQKTRDEAKAYAHSGLAPPAGRAAHVCCSTECDQLGRREGPVTGGIPASLWR